jgi:two-component system, cell cycle sensor histidine kinase and response regulator CckA
MLQVDPPRHHRSGNGLTASNVIPLNGPRSMHWSAGPDTPDEPPPGVPASEPPHTGGRGGPPRWLGRLQRERPAVLIVEDEAVVALDLENRLTRLGYDIVAVADCADEAVARFRETQPDLVLMDISLRGPGDGIEAAQRMASISPVSIVFLTAYADEETIRRAAAVDPSGYLPKPFDERTLSATLRLALERSETNRRLHLLTQAVEAVGVGILLAEVDGEARRTTFCNEAMLALSATPLVNVLGVECSELIGNEPGLASARIKDAIASAREDSAVLLGLRSDGEPFWANTTVSVVRNAQGAATHLLLFVVDVTVQREAENALADSQRLELAGRMSAGTVHDITNVLGAIVSFADLARDSLPEDSPSRRDIEEVMNAAERGVILTRRLLDFCRRNEDAAVGSSDLVQVVRESRRIAERLAGNRVEVRTSISSGRLVVGIDAVSVEQILLNLVANARDALPAGGWIEIGLSCPDERCGAFGPGEYARLEVRDNGAGIPQETLERIFDPFFTTKPRGSGTGLGLSTCRMLVQRAGGIIQVESRPGVGTRFCIDLPLHQGTVLKPVGPAPGAGGRPVRREGLCLLVEDDESLRHACARALMDAGFDVIEAEDGAAASLVLERLGNRLRLVVCAMLLPDGHAAGVFDRVREHAPQAAHLMLGDPGSAPQEVDAGNVVRLPQPLTPAFIVQRAMAAVAGVPVQSGLPPHSPPQDDKREPVTAYAAAGGNSNELPRPPCVLLVEDHASLRAALAGVLRARGLEVIEAAEPVKALERLAESSVTLAIVDVDLPDTDAGELLAALRRQEALMPIIAMSNTLPAAQQAGLRLRGHGATFLTKPILPGMLMAEVERTLSEGELAELRRSLLMARGVGARLDPGLRDSTSCFEEALRNLYLVWQPIVAAFSPSVFAFEVLMRCDLPALMPSDIIGLAETLGRVDELGRVVRKKLAGVLASPRHDDLEVFLNVHPLEVTGEALLAADDPLRPYASRVVLEITERAQLASNPVLANSIHRLRDIGYRVALDDLGEGYAGLSWLVKLSPEIAKIDMSLVRDIDTSRIKRELVASLIGVCRREGTLVVAEGVESEAEAKVLFDLGCDLLQGYHFGRPGPLPGG